MDRIAPRIVDCHFHVFGDVRRFPIVPTAAYTPRIASLAEHTALFGPRGMTRRVIVAASCYGTDNSCHLEALAEEGVPDGGAGGRAVVSVNSATPDAAMATMTQAGARGARFNTISPGAMGFSELFANAARMRAQNCAGGWHAELYTTAEKLGPVFDQVMATGLDVVVAHYAELEPADGLNQPAVRMMDRLLESGRGWLKLSAPYRVSTAPGYADLEPYARHFLQVRPDRLIWGSDWPYIHHEEKLGAWDPMQPLAGWMSVTEAEAVYWNNPARLYGMTA